MPHRAFSLEEVATYLHLNVPDVEELVKYHEIPFVMRGGRLPSPPSAVIEAPPSSTKYGQAETPVTPEQREAYIAKCKTLLNCVGDDLDACA